MECITPAERAGAGRRRGGPAEDGTRRVATSRWWRGRGVGVGRRRRRDGGTAQDGGAAAGCEEEREEPAARKKGRGG